MDNNLASRSPMARRNTSRWAMSLLEVTVVLAIVGILTTASITRFGYSALGNGGAEGFARKLSFALTHARRSTISTGDNHYLRLTTSGGSISSYALFRKTGGGDVQVDETRMVPKDVAVTSGASVLEFDFEGSALAGYVVAVAGPNRSWSVSVTTLTGAVQVVETTP